MRTTVLLSALLLLAGISCGKVSEQRPDREPDGVKVKFQLALRAPSTRSSFCPDDMDRVSDINVWIYQKGVLLSDYSFHRPVGTDMEIGIVFPSVYSLYNIYMFANVGSVNAPALESDIGSACATLNSYSSFSERGFPMAGFVSGFSPLENGSLTLERLVGRYDIHTYDNPANTMVRYTVLSGKMKACAKVIRPFGSVEGHSGYASRAVSGSEILADGDVLSASDIASLNAGGTVTLYYLENCQGRLLPANDTQYGKSAAAIASATGDPDRPDICSYLELCCSASTPTADYASITYRAYLGRDATSDFSIVRNSVHSLTLDMAPNLISGTPWFVEPDSPGIKRSIVVTRSLLYPQAQIQVQGWNNAVCPGCGAAWGSDSYHLQEVNASTQTYRCACSCGWSGSTSSAASSAGVSSLRLFDFTTALVQVLSDLAYGDTYSVSFKSNGAMSANGFTVVPVSTTGVASRSFRITNNNATNPSSLSGASISDVLVVKSYDGLIVREIPVEAITHAIPLHLDRYKYGLSARLTTDLTASSPDYVSTGISGTGISFQIKLTDLTLRYPGRTSNVNSSTDRTISGCTTEASFPIDLTDFNYWDVRWPEFRNKYPREVGDGWFTGTTGTSSNYYGNDYVLGGRFAISGASISSPYELRSGYKIKMGFADPMYKSANSSLTVDNVNFNRHNAGQLSTYYDEWGNYIYNTWEGKRICHDAATTILDPVAGGYVGNKYVINFPVWAKAYSESSGTSTGYKKIWTVFPMQCVNSGSLTDLRTLDGNGDGFWQFTP